MKNFSRQKNEKGIALIEVLIALFIVSVTLPALLFRTQNILDASVRMEEKTFANWIAENKIQEVSLQKRLGVVLPKTLQKDSVEFAGRMWHWQMESEVRPFNPQGVNLGNTRRVDVKVGLSEDKWISSLYSVLKE